MQAELWMFQQAYRPPQDVAAGSADSSSRSAGVDMGDVRNWQDGEARGRLCAQGCVVMPSWSCAAVLWAQRSVSSSRRSVLTACRVSAD